jgi:integrase/recombinase XerD
MPFLKEASPTIRIGRRIAVSPWPGIDKQYSNLFVIECAGKAGVLKLVNPETGRGHNVSPQRLRDAFAVNAVKVDDAGDRLELLQEHLGHQSFNTIAKHRKVSGKEHRDWYRKL